MRKRILQAVAYAWGVIAFLSLTASGQINTATVTGVVTDATHAIVPQAQSRSPAKGWEWLKPLCWRSRRESLCPESRSVDPSP